MEIFLLYLFTRLTVINNVLSLVAILGTILGVMVLAFSLAETRTESGVKIGKRMIVAGVVAVFGLVIIPTQKDAAVILAGWGVLEIAKSETAGRLASKSAQLIEQTIDGYLKEKAK